jgi:hypothetical protein
MQPIAVRGRLSYADSYNEAFLVQCACEPSNPQIPVCLAVAGGQPTDINGANSYLHQLGYVTGSDLEVIGIFATVGQVRVFYMQQVNPCPTGPCDQ